MQNLINQKLQLKQLVTGENGITAAIEALKVLLPTDSPKFNGLLQLEADFNQLKLSDIKGIIAEEQFRLAVNQVRERLIQLIDLLNDKDFQKKAVAAAGVIQKKNYATYWIGGGLLLAIAVALWLWQPWSAKFVEPSMVLVEGNGGDIKDFYIGKYEVTVEAFGAFIEETGFLTEVDRNNAIALWRNNTLEFFQESRNINWRCDVSGKSRNDPRYKEYPVIFVSREDAIAYTQWLSKKTNKKYRLPKNKEWEYAALGGNKSQNFDFYGSNDLNAIAWFDENAFGATHPVGEKMPNELGIYDMAGNVAEWCDEVHPKDGKRRYVARGGAWTFGRTFLDPKQVDFGVANVSNFIGFRLVRDL